MHVLLVKIKFEAQFSHVQGEPLQGCRSGGGQFASQNTFTKCEQPAATERSSRCVALDHLLSSLTSQHGWGRPTEQETDRYRNRGDESPSLLNIPPPQTSAVRFSGCSSHIHHHYFIKTETWDSGWQGRLRGIWCSNCTHLWKHSVGLITLSQESSGRKRRIMVFQ